MMTEPSEQNIPSLGAVSGQHWGWLPNSSCVERPNESRYC